MDIKKLAVFGDSWIYGDELVDPGHPEWECCFTQNDEYRLEHCFSGLIAKELGIPYENYGQPGASLQSTIWTFLWWLNNRNVKDTLILIGLTGADRQSWYNPEHVSYSNDPKWNKYIHSTWINYGSSIIPNEWREFGKQYITLSHCDALSKLNYQQAVMFFDGISATKNINMLQFNLYQQPMVLKNIKTLYEPGKDLQSIMLSHPESRRLHAPGHHPNEAGHEVISKLLLSEIKDVKLA